MSERQMPEAAPEADPERKQPKSLQARLSKRSAMLRIQICLAAAVTAFNLAMLI